MVLGSWWIVLNYCQHEMGTFFLRRINSPFICLWWKRHTLSSMYREFYTPFHLYMWLGLFWLDEYRLFCLPVRRLLSTKAEYSPMQNRTFNKYPFCTWFIFCNTYCFSEIYAFCFIILCNVLVHKYLMDCQSTTFLETSLCTFFYLG